MISSNNSSSTLLGVGRIISRPGRFTITCLRTPTSQRGMSFQHHFLPCRWAAIVQPPGGTRDQRSAEHLCARATGHNRLDLGQGADGCPLLSSLHERGGCLYLWPNRTCSKTHRTQLS